MIAPADAFEAAVAIGRSLEQHGVSYAIGGALAYGQYGVPRATNDVDVNVFVGPDGLGDVLAALGGVGIEMDHAAAVAATAREGMFIARLGDLRIDVFTPSIDFAWEAERTRVRHVVDGVDVWFLSAEALSVFKMLFFRTKDVADLERLVAVWGGRLDSAYVRARLVEMMGAADQRVETWDRLWADFGPR